MQASTSPEISSQYRSDFETGEASEAVRSSQHQFQNDFSHLFSKQSAKASTCEQLESPSPFLPSQQPKISRRRETRCDVACQRCRDLKVRCDTVQGNSSCKRCLQGNRTCEKIESNKKKTEKISKIEKKIFDLQIRIQQLTQELAVAKAEIVDENGHLNLGLNNLSPLTKFSQTAFPSYQTPVQYPNYATDPSSLYNLRAAHVFEDDNALCRKRMIFNCESQLPNNHQLLVPAEVARYSLDPNSHMMAMAASTAPAPGQTGIWVPIPAYADVLMRCIPDPADAYRIFDHFVRSMAPQIPIIVISEYIHPEDILVTRPTLFLAILSVAAPLEIQAPLSSEFLRIFGHSIFADQETSLELIQALQVIIVWALPTGGRDARCSQYCSIACTMAISLGMNIPSGKKEDWSLWSEQHPEESGEGARAYVGCFILGSMYVKRPLRLFAVLPSW